MMNHRGFSVLEPLLAIGLMATILLTITSLLVMTNFQSEKVSNHQKAIWFVQEGVSALKTIDFDNLFVTTSGSLHFTPSTTIDGYWQLTENGPENKDQFTREIYVNEIRRGDSCLISNSPSSTIDVDSLELISKVSWVESTGQEQNITLKTIRTNWQNPKSSCFDNSDLAQLYFNFSGTMWFGGKQLRNIFITNIGTRDVEIDKVRLTWNYPFLIQQMFIGQNKVWSSAGPGTPSGNQESGIELDIANRTISIGETVEMEKTQFTGLMEGSTITIKVTMPDGSSTTTQEFTPIY